jgi:hypothetical protein
MARLDQILYKPNRINSKEFKKKKDIHGYKLCCELLKNNVFSTFYLTMLRKSRRRVPTALSKY